MRRYVVSIGPNETIVRLDAKRCAIGAFEMKGTNVDGRCAQVDEIPDVMQTELDRVGAKVTSALK